MIRENGLPEDVTVRGTLVCARGCISLDAPVGDASFGGDVSLGAGKHVLRAAGDGGLAGGAVSFTHTPPGVILTVAVGDAGTGYEVDDILTLGTGSGAVRVLTVDDTEGNEGAILTVGIEVPDYGYTVGSYNLVGGKGEGASLQVLSVSEVKGDVFITNNESGLILKSPNGSLHRVQVANDGTLSTQDVA